MANRLTLAGDVNLMNVVDPAVPLRHVVVSLNEADVAFGNLECCLHLPARHSHATEGFFAEPQAGGEALKLSGLHAVGIANNVNYGTANVAASIARLDQIGMLHTGAGPNLAAARSPAIVSRNGLRVGFLQRSSVYWPTDHEAHDDAPGIAVLQGHTAYHVPMAKIAPHIPPPNRPGLPPVIVTWADPKYLVEFRTDIEALRPQVDIVVASCHWGLGREPLQYMTDIAHTAIDAGADIVIGHGPHFPLPVEVYRDRPVFYGLCNLIFNTGHGGRQHAGWIGLLVELGFDRGRITGCDFRFVRNNDREETYFCRPADESETLADLTARSARLGARLVPDGDRVRVEAANTQGARP